MNRTVPALVAVLSTVLILGADWPTFLGPTRDNVSTEKDIIAPWPKEGLRKVWDCELGAGYAPPVAAAGKLYHFDRFGNSIRLTCRDAATGAEKWKFEYPTDYEDYYGYDPGPRACPVVDGDRVYAYGPDGMLYCVSAADGKELWHVNTRRDFHVHQNFFGVGSVPVVDGDLLIVAVGGSPDGRRPIDLRLAKPNGTGIVAFDKKTGKVKYRTADELSSYSSPVIRTINGKKTGLYFARGGLLGFDPQTGKVGFHYKWRAPVEESVNAACPVVVGDRILLTECYGPGAACLDIVDGKVKEVWTDGDKEKFDKSLMCHWNTPVYHDGYVYGSSGRHETEGDLRCIELKTGEVKWSEKVRARCTLLKVDGYLISLSEYGELTLIKPNPAKYDEVSRFRLPELAYPSWAPPVLSNGLLYVRGKDRLICLELISKK